MNYSMKRMSAVVRTRARSNGKEEDVVVAKGAPEVIKLLLAEIPRGYDSLYMVRVRESPPNFWRSTINLAIHYFAS